MQATHSGEMTVNLATCLTPNQNEVDWLAEVPNRWRVLRLKDAAHLIMGQSPSSEDCSTEPIGLPFLQGCAEFGITHPSARLYCRCPARVSPKGTILVSVRAPVGRLNLAEQPYGIGRGLCAIVPNKQTLLTAYAHYSLEASVVELGRVSTGSTYDAVSVRDVAELRMPIPPLVEQSSITAVLDRWTERIDGLMERMEALVDRLKEKRKALILYAVTRGIPSTPVLQSDIRSHEGLNGFEKMWLQGVPAHWDITPIKRFHQVVNGGTPSSNDSRYWGGKINWLTPEDLGQNRAKIIGDSRRTLSGNGLENCNAQLVPRNAIVISTRAPIGHTAMVGKESCTNQGCRSLVATDSRAYPDYTYYAVQSSREVLESMGKGTTFMELSAELLGAHRVPLPPIDEQVAIAGYLDRETSKIDTIITRIATVVLLLKEYRIALVTAAVTGAIDERQVNASTVAEYVAHRTVEGIPDK